MAIYRLEAKIIGREKRGRSVVAAAAYRAGEKLFGAREEKTYDYTRRSKGVVASKILCPEGAPEWAAETGSLWNSVEASEKRVDAQLAREFILALPNELTTEDQFQLAVEWSQRELVQAGMVAQVCLHHSKDGTNPHAHVLCTMRRFDGSVFSAKKARDWDQVTVLAAQRESWADAVNVALERAGIAARVDHRSLKDRGLDLIPQPKIGIAATAMERKGLVEDPRRFQDVRFIKTLNDVMPQMRSLRCCGEVKQMGHGNTWWEKSIVFLSRVREQARETVMDVWQKMSGRMMLEPWKRGSHDVKPPTQKGPDISR